MKTACTAPLQPMTQIWVKTAEGVPADASPLPNATAISLGLIEQTAEKAPRDTVQVEQQLCNGTQISCWEANREAAPADAPADGHAVGPTAHMAFLQHQVSVTLSAALVL